MHGYIWSDPTKVSGLDNYLYEYNYRILPPAKFMESEFQLRTKDQYMKHCEFIHRDGISDSERMHFSKVYGINQRSILTDLPAFDVTEQLPQDLMHVLLEGIFPLHLEQFLQYIIQDLHLMT